MDEKTKTSDIIDASAASPSSPDASSRRTIALGDSTPAPAHFRQPPTSGPLEFNWAARADKLAQRVAKLQLRLVALEDGFADPDDPTKEELDQLEPLQRARDAMLIELRAAKEALSGPPSRGASPTRAAAGAAPVAVAKVPTPPKYPQFPNDASHPPFTRDVQDVPRWMRTAEIWFAQESSPAVPDVATRLRLLTGAMGSAELKLAYANWLAAAGGAATWESARAFLTTQVPWRDLPVLAMQSVLNYPEMKVTSGKDTSLTLLSFISGYQNLLGQNGMDTSIPASAGAFTDRFESDGTTLTPTFALLDRMLCQILVSKLTPEVRSAYLAQRALEATAYFKAHDGAYLSESLTSMLASLARLHLPTQAPIQIFKTGGGGSTFADLARGGDGGGWIRAAGNRGGHGGGRRFGQADQKSDRSGADSRSGSPGLSGAGARVVGCFHCGDKHHSARECPKQTAAGITRPQFAQLQGPGNAKHLARLALDANKRAVTLNAVGQPGGGNAAATTHVLREQLHVLSNDYNKLFTRFSVENSRQPPSEDDSTH